MLTPCVYAALVALGMAMRAVHIFDENAPAILSRIMLNLTLPAAVISTFAGFDGDASLYFLILIGFGCSVVPFLAAWLCTRRMRTEMRAYSMLNVCGYNIGCFSLPIVQGAAGSVGAAAVCLFDIGNALVMTGGSYAGTTALLRLQGFGKNPVAAGAQRLLRSVPFDTYVVMLVLLLSGIAVPAKVADVLAPLAGSNGFLAMLTAGLMFSPSDFRRYFRSAIVIVAIRFAMGCVLAACAWFFLPYSETVRFSLMLAAFAPVSALAPVYSEKCSAEGARSGLTLSFSVAAALVGMLALTAWRLYF